MLTDDTNGNSGNLVNQFFPYSNGHSYHNGDYMNNGFMNARKEIVEAVFAANSHVANGSVFSDNGQAFLQHFMAANPAGLMNMKLWWGGVVIPDEVSYSEQLCHSRP